MLAGTLSPECCLINAELVPELRVLHVAAHKALVARRRGTLRTRSLHSELIFNLSGSKHVRASQRQQQQQQQRDLLRRSAVEGLWRRFVRCCGA